MLKNVLAIAGAITLAALSACGQKGPLYLPESTGTVITRQGSSTAPATPESAPAPNSTTEDSNKKEEAQKPE